MLAISGRKSRPVISIYRIQKRTERLWICNNDLIADRNEIDRAPSVTSGPVANPRFRRAARRRACMAIKPEYGLAISRSGASRPRAHTRCPVAKC